MELCSMRSVLPFVGMVIIMLVQVSNMEVIKAAISTGMNKYVIIVYSDALSSLIFLLCSLLIHRCSSQIFSYVGIQYRSPTLTAAMLNLIPAFTFMLAIIFSSSFSGINETSKKDRDRTYKPLKGWKSKSSQAKSLGTLLSIAGAFVVTFYKGRVIMRTLSHSVSPHRLFLSPQLYWILGAFFLAAEAFLSSAWFSLQAIILKRFPAVLIIMFYLFFFNTILSTIFALILVTDPKSWKLRLDMGLIAILYSATIGTGFRISLCTWCLSKIGPLYVSMFKPLAIVFSIVMDAIFLGEALHLGRNTVYQFYFKKSSINYNRTTYVLLLKSLVLPIMDLWKFLIGAVIIVAGFYAVMWGKSKEEKTTDDTEVGSLRLSSEKVPLLENRIEEKCSKSLV